MQHSFYKSTTTSFDATLDKPWIYDFVCVLGLCEENSLRTCIVKKMY